MTNQTTPTLKKRRTGSAPPGFERISRLSARICFAPSTIQGWVANPDLQFPAPTKLGQRVAIYNTAAVDAWLEKHLGVKVAGDAAPARGGAPC